MLTNSNSIASLRRLFLEGFTARDIAEPLVSFDDVTAAASVKRFMEERKFEVVGIRQNGHVTGFARGADLGDGVCAVALQGFRESQVVLDSTPLSDVLSRLKGNSHLFVSTLGTVAGMISRTDLQKPPVRMWLFGLITLLEMRFTRLIEEFLPDGAWRTSLSEGRIRKAEALQMERRRHDLDVSLLECLQISDKATIVARSEQLRAMTRFDSKRQLEDATKAMERLRNSLAHSQDIVTNDWDTICLMTERLESILVGPRRFGDTLTQEANLTELDIE